MVMRSIYVWRLFRPRCVENDVSRYQILRGWQVWGGLKPYQRREVPIKRVSGHAVRLCWTASSCDTDSEWAERIVRIGAVLTGSEPQTAKWKKAEPPNSIV
jgi:hypothetical protein